MAKVLKNARDLFAKNLSGVKNELAAISDAAKAGGLSREDLGCLTLRKQVAMAASDIIKQENDTKADNDLMKRMAAVEAATSAQKTGAAVFSDDELEGLDEISSSPQQSQEIN